MKKPIMLILIIICISFLYAENSDINLKFGVEISPTLNWQKLDASSSEIEDTEDNGKISFSSNLFLLYKINQDFLLKTSLGFDLVNGENKIILNNIDATGSISYKSSITYTYNFNSISGKILAQYNLPKNFALSLGGRFYTPVSNLNLDFKSSNRPEINESFDIKESKLNNLNYSLVTNVNYSIKNYIVSLEYDHSLKGIQSNKSLLNQFSDWKTRSIKLSLGYLLF